MDVRFHRIAIREYREARDWYERQRSGLGPAYVAEVDRTIARIIENPERFPPDQDGFRRARLHRFPYAVYFHEEGADVILVLAVAHARRREGYWRRRLGKP
jgi:plasmid stabilization system protein ParE